MMADHPEWFQKAAALAGANGKSMPMGDKDQRKAKSEGGQQSGGKED